nr:phage portal protein [Pseudomonadaceae bacterium]
MNLSDRIISHISPGWAVNRIQRRRQLALYEAAKPKRTQRNPKSTGSANVSNNVAADLRGMARHLEENYDFASGILDVLVRNTVGKGGIGIEPAPKDSEGNVHLELAKNLRALWTDFMDSPEVTKTMDWASVCQLMARTWFRDGEAFSKDIVGNVRRYAHGTRVAYSLELLEPDYCPFEHSRDPNIIQGIQFNEWRQPTRYFFYDRHPGETVFVDRLRPVPADRVNHLRSVKRLHQARGVTSFATVISRLNNIADYEKYEQVAAKIAASMTGYIKKGNPDMYTPPAMADGEEKEYRELELSAGTFFDDLEIGEEIGTVQSNRPSGLLEGYLKHMMRGAAAGTGAGPSSVSKSYDGSYSAQRQELVEQWENYGLLSRLFIAQFVKPVWRRFVDMALMVIDVPNDVDPNRLYEADFLAPQMPWIDPYKEAAANEKLLKQKVVSPQQVIRARGQSPQHVLDQWEQWQEEMTRRKLNAADKNGQPNQRDPLLEDEDD